MLGALIGIGRPRRHHAAAALLTGALLAAVSCPSPALASSTSSPVNAPTNLTVSGQTKTTLTVTWTPSSSLAVTGYDVLVNGVSYSSVPGVAATIAALRCGTTYTLSVEAHDSSGNLSSPASTRGTTSPCTADIAVVSNTPSVSQAQAGQDVTFTVLATNKGPDPVELFVDTGKVLDGLSVVSVTCVPGPSGADGTQCEYDFFVYPGETVTATLVAQVQASGSQFASAAACVLSGGGPIEDPDPSNNCAIGTVEINSPGTIPAGAPPPSGSTPVDQVVAPPVPTPSPAQQTVPQTTSPPAGSGATTSTAQVRAQLLSQLAPSGSAASIAALLRRRGYTFRWGAPGGGRLVIHWYDYLPMRARLSRVTLKPVIVAAGEASFAKAGVVKLTIKLTASGRRLLNKAKRLELTATATYTPSGAPAVTARRSFTLRR